MTTEDRWEFRRTRRSAGVLVRVMWTAEGKAELLGTDLGRWWRGKKLFVDFDDTLATCVPEIDVPDSRTCRPRGPRVMVENSIAYEMIRINHEAIWALGELKRAGAMPIITSAARSVFLDKAVELVGIADVVDGVFSAEELEYERNGTKRAAPKNFDPVVEAVGESDPLSNCVVVGNDPYSDVPVSPMGMVAGLTTLDFPFSDIVRTMTLVLQEGAGSFAAGFDKMVREGRQVLGHAELQDVPQWTFVDRREGRARVVYFDKRSVEATDRLSSILG